MAYLSSLLTLVYLITSDVYIHVGLLLSLLPCQLFVLLPLSNCALIVCTN